MQYTLVTNIHKTFRRVNFFRISLFLIILSPFASLPPPVQGLFCYSCTYTKTTHKDKSCVTYPLATNGIVDCNKRYCTIMRQETIKPREVVSFVRGCDDKPIFINKVIMDDNFATYFRSCSKDLCNSFDGIAMKDPNVGASNNTIIAGRNKAQSTFHRSRIVGVIVRLLISSKVFIILRDF